MKKKVESFTPPPKQKGNLNPGEQKKDKALKKKTEDTQSVKREGRIPRHLSRGILKGGTFSTDEKA